jgi:ATP-dependent helicase/nuclease subunit B
MYDPTVITAASRLEQFAACPFAYYVTYNLKAKERKIYQVRHTDLGVLFHEVLAVFSRQLSEEGVTWGSLTREEITERAALCVEQSLADENVLFSSARNRHVLNKVKRICAASLWALCEHVKRGVFTPAGMEMDFKPDSPLTSLEVHLNNQRRLVLTGRIDRVDILHTADGNLFVKIIDYKSGKMKFDIGEVLLGTQLQLMLYMDALLKNANQLFGDGKTKWTAQPGGVFYFHIDDPLLPMDEEAETDEQQEALLLKCFRMSGLALADKEAVTGMDKGLHEGGESPIIPVGITQTGTFTKASSVSDGESFAQLGQDVREKIKEIGQLMTEGVIAPNPLVSGRKSACDYCRYGAICQISV